MKNIFICLDVGGTEVKGAAVCADGSLLSSLRHYHAYANGSLERLTARFIKIILELSSVNTDDKIGGVRLAFPGPFDYKTGICLLEGLSKYDALYGVNLREVLTSGLREVVGERLSDSFDIRFANDVAAFALGELHFGAAIDSAKSIFVCIGTGCGSAFGKGQELASSDVPHVPENGYIYGTAFHDSCIDDYISRRGICKLSEEMLGKPMDGYALAQSFSAGDSAAGECFAAFGELTREALSPFLAAYEPDILVLGGQIMRSSELFLPPLQKECDERKIQLHLSDDTSLLTIQGLLTI